MLLFVSERQIEGRMWGKKSDEQMRDLVRVRSEVEGLEYLFYLLPQLCGQWRAGKAFLDKYTIMFYHLSL